MARTPRARPAWTDNVTILAKATLARNAVSRTTFDWRTKWGGFVFIRLGRGGATALGTAVTILLRRTINNAAILSVGTGTPTLTSTIAAATVFQCAASGNAIGDTTLVTASNTGAVAGDIIFIDGTGGTGNSEFQRIARVTDSTHLLLDAPLIYAHANATDTVRTKADQWAVWLEGGATYELIVDYGAAASGETITIEALAQTLDQV